MRGLEKNMKRKMGANQKKNIKEEGKKYERKSLWIINEEKIRKFRI